MGMVHQRGLGRPVSLRSSAFPRFEWDLPLDGTLRRKLDVSVKSNSSFMSRERELLGKVQLDLAEIDLSQGAAQWYDLIDDRDKGGS